MPQNTNCVLPDQKKFEKLKQNIHKTCQEIEKFRKEKQQQEHEKKIHKDLYDKTTSKSTRDQENKIISDIDKKLKQLDQDICRKKDLLTTLSKDLKDSQNQYEETVKFCQNEIKQACEVNAEICRVLGEPFTMDLTPTSIQTELDCLDVGSSTLVLEDEIPSTPSTSNSFMYQEELNNPHDQSLYPTLNSPSTSSAPPSYEDVTNGDHTQQENSFNNTQYDDPIKLDNPQLEPNGHGQSLLGKLSLGFWS
ncbi:MAG: hypothetical protein AB8U25_00220 [Rickettsiales endosymbiont of Dermacentor nuttalli]